jgi:hypothetical protein
MSIFISEPIVFNLVTNSQLKTFIYKYIKIKILFSKYLIEKLMRNFVLAFRNFKSKLNIILLHYFKYLQITLNYFKSVENVFYALKI